MKDSSETIAVESLIPRRGNLCKICTVFDDDTLREITIDILLRRRTYKEIRQFYSSKLPAGVAKINDMNINFHRKHSDPAALAKKYLQAKGEYVTEGETISKLYEQRFQEELDRAIVLEEIYRERLGNLWQLQFFRSKKKEEYESLSIDSKSELKRRSLEKEIVDFTERIDEIQSSLRQVIIKELNSERGIGEGAVHVTQNIVNVFQDSLKGFLSEVTPYLLLEVFAQDPMRGQVVVRHLGKIMDKHLAPAFGDTRLLQRKPVKAEVVD